MLKFIKTHTEAIVIAAIFVAVIALFCLWLAIIYYEQMAWETFQETHHCRKVSSIQGSTVVGMGTGSNGGVVMTVGSTPEQTGWLCDDGVTYYR